MSEAAPVTCRGQFTFFPQKSRRSSGFAQAEKSKLSPCAYPSFTVLLITHFTVSPWTMIEKITTA
jgi:hypothetical protein